MCEIKFPLYGFIDIYKGNILTLIETNVKLNSHWIKGKVEVEELDFYNHNYSEKMTSLIEKANVIIAADGRTILNNYTHCLLLLCLKLYLDY